MNKEILFDHIPILRPWLGEEEASAVREVILSGWVSLGPKVGEFEDKVCQYLKVDNAMATNACTTSLHLALKLKGVERGDEVILPAHTCMATANAIEHCGGIPVFADSEHSSYGLCAEDVASKITERTKAILHVHLYGIAGDVEGINQLALKHGIPVIHDAASSFGAGYRGKKLGHFPDVTVFSFHPRKMITTGEGGMLVTGEQDLVKKGKILRSTGTTVSDFERHKSKGTIHQAFEDSGYNYRMTDMQAAMGLVQLGKVEDMIAARRTQARRYNEAFAEMDEIGLMRCPDLADPVYTSYIVHFKEGSQITAEDAISRMAELGISCRLGIRPLHREAYYASRHDGLHLPVAEQLEKECFFLPIFPGLSEAEQQHIIKSFKSLFTGKTINLSTEP